MKLSIITICFNQPDIEETCESIVNQTFQDFEWIVIDGGSTDNTIENLNKYKNRINVFISEKDNGRYDGMNKGIKLAKGEWLNFMNGGDSFAETTALEKVFRKEHDADILYGNINLKNANKKMFPMKYPEEIDKIYFLNNNINHQASFIRKDLFDKYGFYEETFKINADWEKWLCFLSNGAKFKLLTELIANYKTDGISFDCSPETVIEDLKEKKEILKKYYTESELDTLKPYEKNRYKLFYFIPFIKVAKFVNRTEIYLFGCSIIKIKKCENKTRILLFNLPVLAFK